MGETLYTIGHSNHSLDAFVDLLREHGVSRVVDVRSVPYSKYAPHFRKNELSAALGARDFAYHFMDRELGGKIDVDYGERARQEDFVAAVEALIRLARMDATAILCAERDPRGCHRRLLLTPALTARGVLVAHILGDGSIVHDEDLEPDGSQLSLF